MKQLSIYILSSVSLLTILNLIFAAKESNGGAVFSQLEHKRNESLVVSKMEESSIFRRKLLKVMPENKTLDNKSYDDDYICKTKSKLLQRGDEVMNYDCKSNGSDSENLFEGSRNHTLKNLFRFRKEQCKPKKLLQKRAIDNSGRGQDTEAQEDCKKQNGVYDSNNNYDTNNVYDDADQDDDYGGEGQDDNYDQDENADNNYDDYNNEITKKKRRSDNNNLDGSLDKGYDDNNQDYAQGFLKDGNKNNDNNYNDVGNDQQNKEGNDYEDYQENNEGNENEDYQENDYGNNNEDYQDNDQGNENEYGQENAETDNENNENYGDIYGGGHGEEERGHWEEGELDEYRRRRRTVPDDDDDVDTPQTTRKRKRTRRPRFPGFPPRRPKTQGTKNFTLSTDMPGGLGKYFVYVNCTTCKIKSQLVVLSKKGSSPQAPKTTQKFPDYN